ncbi:MAG: hypothetical protein WBV73_08495 [Phormidium sp.]
MLNYTFVPPIWIICPDEGLKLRIAIESELLGTITDGEQLQTIIRYQRFGTTPANGDFIEGIAAVTSSAGLVIGIQRRLYVTWLAPAINPALNYSRYFVTILALPTTMTSAPNDYPAAISLLETQRFCEPSNLLEDINTQLPFYLD